MELYNSKGDFGGAKFKGGANFTLTEIMKGNNLLRFLDTKKNRSPGHIKFREYKIEYEYKLTDYLKGGMNISADFLINFSEKNIDESKQNLHELSKQRNPYLQTIEHAYQILEQHIENASVS